MALVSLKHQKPKWFTIDGNCAVALALLIVSTILTDTVKIKHEQLYEFKLKKEGQVNN
jgi:hypothetical protein